MTRAHEDSRATPHLGGVTAILVFAFTLVAFVAESELTGYVQSSLGFRVSFSKFSNFVAHSSFSIIFPLHLLYLVVWTGHSHRRLLNGLRIAITKHLEPPSRRSGTPLSRTPFPTFKFVRLVFLMTLGVTIPALMWFAAVSMAPVADVTAIWNTNAFFAYLITVHLFKLPWEFRKLAAVLLATIGVLAVVYGGIQDSTEMAPEAGNPSSPSTTSAYTWPLMGDLLTLVASVGYGLYQVLYKRHAALPSDPEFEPEPSVGGGGRGVYAHPSRASATSRDTPEVHHDAVYPPPFGFHANFLTSAIGIVTFSVLWIFIPILHFMGAEPFRFPNTLHIALSVLGIGITGVAFNSGFMILLGVWGPIITSVGNLLTIVLVYAWDILIGGAADLITTWSLLGAGGIVVAFGILAYDMWRTA
ncbi:uncharacterized protein STEHIDRAFT_63538 [Stereum hirsutum FP-91666 SS1]|uniref:uncharacterized protein n=1 Tax=Stereum hirsutum (strain FP-91666) TaxID=721885 RepID=UPI0004449CFC|nr:uncharacterized protein STEHIDRAFT_63538 [Stereum hirsutum FP-91666 SS1]EIM83461.1 hypothetical protein STEHIDRAFT_63538 [Stereum hirsutum FP-91666 SS1]